MTNEILPPKAPNLPLAPQDYLRTYFDQLNSILRLYFNQLDGYHNVTSATTGSFCALTTQTVSGANTATLITLDSANGANGVGLDTVTHQITVSKNGRYLFIFDVPPSSGSWGGGATQYVWFRLNGSDIVESTHNGSGSCLISMNTSDYVEMYWAASSATATLPASGATGFCPATPSVNVNVIFVST